MPIYHFNGSLHIPHSMKNARSHNPDINTSEITEPILEPTTSRNVGDFRVEPEVKDDFISKLTNSNKEISYNFYDVGEPEEWVPRLKQAHDPKWNREDRSKAIKPEEIPLEMIATTVQFLPQKLARMAEQAEKYATEMILPLVSTYTPKFISDIITPKEPPKYLPLDYDETTKSVETTPKFVAQLNHKRPIDNAQFDPPPKIEVSSATGTTTPYTHIQRIKRKGDDEITTESIAEDTVAVETSRKIRNDAHSRKNILEMKLEALADDLVMSTTKKSKGVYVELPVFDGGPPVKYIPVSIEDSTSHR